MRELQDKRLGKKIVVVCDSRDGLDQVPPDGSHGEVLVYGPSPAVKDEARAPLVAVTGQLLGLFFSLGAGLRPDNPSPAGVITRVVQGVRIHPYDAHR